MSPLRGTTKPARNVASQLTRQGHKVSADTVGDLLLEAGFSLQANTKIFAIAIQCGSWSSGEVAPHTLMDQTSDRCEPSMASRSQTFSETFRPRSPIITVFIREMCPGVAHSSDVPR